MGDETGWKWVVRYVIVPTIGGGGLVALIVAYIMRPQPPATPQNTQAAPTQQAPAPAPPAHSPKNESPDTPTKPDENQNKSKPALLFVIKDLGGEFHSGANNTGNRQTGNTENGGRQASNRQTGNAAYEYTQTDISSQEATIHVAKGDTLHFEWDVPNANGQLYFVVVDPKSSRMPVGNKDKIYVAIDGNSTFSLEDAGGALRTVHVQADATPHNMGGGRRR